MKRKLFVMMLLSAALLALAGFAMAETDPIVCGMEVNPQKLAAPGPVDVTITISNSGDTDMKDPVTLYNPVSQVVEDFGTKGSVVLKAGESKTWTGKWDVNERTLSNGSIVFFVKYKLYKDSGEAYETSQPIRGKISAQAAAADVEIKRTISPGTARKDQVVTVKYDIINSGTVSVKNVTIQESISKDPQKVAEVKPGETAQVKFSIKMGTKDLLSKASITYQTAGSNKTEKKDVPEQKITYGEPAMNAKFTSSAKGVAVNGKITLTLELKNNGNVDYSDLRVTDPTLGDVFTNQKLEKGGTLKLEKEITLTATTDYQFTITAIDNTGTEVSLSTDALTLTAVDPSKALHLEVVVTPDRTEVFEQPGRVRFSVEVKNDSEVEAKDVSVLHGSTKIYTFASIKPGESRRLTRDAALSQEGKYQFTATTVDALANSLSFPSNEVQIKFSVPTPAPATPTPPAVPTAEPTFSPASVPPIWSPAVGSFPKTIQTILMPVSIISALLLLGSGVLLLMATKRRADQKKASDAAYDHLERSKRRDYVNPAEPEEEPAVTPLESDRLTDARGAHAARDRKRMGVADNTEVPLDDVELPHLKYVRNAYERKGSVEAAGDGYRSAASSLYDDDLYGVDDVLQKPGENGVMYEEAYDDPYRDVAYDGGYQKEDSYAEEGRAADGAYGDGYAQEYSDGYGDTYQEGYEAGGYADDYAEGQEGAADGHYGDDRLSDPYGDPLPGSYDDGFEQAEKTSRPERGKRTGSRAEPQGTDIGY